MNYFTPVLTPTVLSIVVNKFGIARMKRLKISMKELAHAAMPYYKEYCTIYKDGFSWLGERGEWNCRDISKVLINIKEYITNS